MRLCACWMCHFVRGFELSAAQSGSRKSFLWHKASKSVEHLSSSVKEEEERRRRGAGVRREGRSWNSADLRRHLGPHCNAGEMGQGGWIRVTTR